MNRSELEAACLALADKYDELAQEAKRLGNFTGELRKAGHTYPGIWYHGIWYHDTDLETMAHTARTCAHAVALGRDLTSDEVVAYHNQHFASRVEAIATQGQE